MSKNTFLKKEAIKEAIAELADPFAPKNFVSKNFVSKKFVSKKTVQQIYPAARRRAASLKRWIIKRLKQTPETPSPQHLPIFKNFERDGTPPFSKKALVICEAHGFFSTPEQLQHSSHANQAETVEIARAFNRLGYSVDAMDVFDPETVPDAAYDVVFGEYYNYGRLLPGLPKETLRIFYATRSYWRAEHQAIEERAKRIQRTRGAALPIKHWEEENSWVEQSDAIIVLGNKTTAATFSSQRVSVQRIDNCALYSPPPDLNQKDFSEARKNFLWVGSRTLLRKGLDLVLEAFSTLPDLHLWICGPVNEGGERAFVKAYRQELFHTPNIHPIGFIVPQSETMMTLMNKCAALVFTSCSEGMSGGVLDCMAQGLVPIISQEAGVDTESFGVTLEPCTVEAIREAVVNFASLPPEACRAMAQEAYDKTQTRYTLVAYSRNIEHLLGTAIDQATRVSASRQ